MDKKPSEELIDIVYSCAVTWDGKMAVTAAKMNELFDYEYTPALQPLGNYLEKEVFEACLVLTERGLMKRLLRDAWDSCIRFRVLTPYEIAERKCRKP